MRCLKCGFSNPPQRETCSKCGLPLARIDSDTLSSEVPLSKEKKSERPVSEWRQEVVEKAKAYGERKRTLTTPPRPLKEQEEEGEEPEKAPVKVAPSGATPRSTSPEPTPDTGRPSEVSALRNVTPPVIPQAMEIQAGDVADWNRFDVDSETQDAHPVRLWKRGASLLIDSTIIIVLIGGSVLVAGRLLAYDWRAFVQNTWTSLLELSLLFHCLYYAYFYKTSRQTPGQVFFSLELRDTFSSEIPLTKILIRWTALVFLNFLNLLPAIRKKPLLLDQLSGTEIRSLK